MDENRRLDNELANLTDAVLENRIIEVDGEMAELSEVVRGLNDLIGTGDTPSAAFDERLRQRLDIEWEQRQRQTRRLYFSPALRVASLAAVLVVVLGVVIALVDNSESGGLQGTALGSPEAFIGIVAIAAVVGAAVLLWRSRR